MLAEANMRMTGIIDTAADIMTWHPAVPTMAVVTWNPGPVVPLMPVTAAMIIWPVPDTDREIDRFRLRHHRRGKSCDRCEKN